MLVNKRELAEILGCSEESLTIWQKQGLPILAKGAGKQGNTYNPAEVIKWMRRKDSGEKPATSIDEERQRKLRHEADMLEMENEEKRGELMKVQTVERDLIEKLSRFRARVLSIPKKLAPQVVAERELAVVETLLETQLHEALNELAG